MLVCRILFVLFFTSVANDDDDCVAVGDMALDTVSGAGAGGGVRICAHNSLNT